MLERIKLVCFLLLVLGFMNIPQFAAASNIDWQIVWEDNNVLNEKVIVHPEIKSYQGWQYSSADNAAVLERKIKNWSAYEQLRDKLPIQVTVQDYLLFKNITFKTVSQQVGPETVMGQVMKLKGIDLKISVPGLIRGGSADEVKGLTAVWHLKQINDLGKPGVILTVLTFNGLILGMLIAVVGLLITMLLLWKRVKKTYELIEQEYSLDNLSSSSQQENN